MEHKNPEQNNSRAKEKESIPIRAFIVNLYNQKQDARLVYHHFAWTSSIVEQLTSLATQSRYTKEALNLGQLSAWFYATGYLFDYPNPLRKSLEIAERFMVLNKVCTADQAIVMEAIKAVFKGDFSKSTTAQLLNDAIAAHYYCLDFFEKHPALRLEKELIQGEVFSKANWNEHQLNALLKTKFFTPIGKTTFEPILAQNILKQKEVVEKDRRNLPHTRTENGTQNFQHLERKIPNSANQTFFRTNYRNHINLSAIADNKANIMISVNAIIVSVIISAISYRNITETQPELLMPALIFVITGLTSLIFAVLSARPKVTNVNQNLDFQKAQKNIVFFGNFTNLDLEKYEEAMDAMLRDGALVYGNMTRDLYFLGKVLQQKYRYLSISYNVFMIGFIATVIAFFIALFF